MNILIVLTLLLASLMSWATAIAYLKDTQLSRADVSSLAVHVREAIRLWWRFGWSVVDRHALSASLRPFLRVIVLVNIAGTGFVAMGEAITQTIGLFTALNLLSVVVFMAMQSPCPYILYILRGERRKAKRPFNGSDRRVH